MIENVGRREILNRPLHLGKRSLTNGVFFNIGINGRLGNFA